jgi:hypothetical protein
MCGRPQGTERQISVFQAPTGRDADRPEAAIGPYQIWDPPLA